MTDVAGLDSSYDVPNVVAIARAHAAGVGAWMGYGTVPYPPGQGAAHVWPDTAFLAIEQGGLRTAAFFFGTADPLACAACCARLGIAGFLDVEPPRPDGAWVGTWLARSGLGLYGLRPTLLHWRGHYPAAILADYPDSGDPHADHPADLNLGVPQGWQWQGTHSEFGCSVDRGTYDLRIFGGQPVAATIPFSDGSVPETLSFKAAPGWLGVGQILYATAMPGSAHWDPAHPQFADEIAALMSAEVGHQILPQTLIAFNAGQRFPPPGSLYVVGSVANGIGH